MTTAHVTISAELEAGVAEQLAQFCKRSTFDTFFELTEAHLSAEERGRRAYMMIIGIERIRSALAEAGYAPR